MQITVENVTWRWKTSEDGNFESSLFEKHVRTPSFEQRYLDSVRWKHEFVVQELNVGGSIRMDSEQKYKVFQKFRQKKTCTPIGRWGKT